MPPRAIPRRRGTPQGSPSADRVPAFAPRHARLVRTGLVPRCVPLAESSRGVTPLGRNLSCRQTPRWRRWARASSGHRARFPSPWLGGIDIDDTADPGRRSSRGPAAGRGAFGRGGGLSVDALLEPRRRGGVADHRRRFPPGSSRRGRDRPGGCPCGRPYALLAAIQGREQEALRFPHRQTAPSGWCSPSCSTTSWTRSAPPAGRSCNDPDGLEVLLAHPHGVDQPALAASLQAGADRPGRRRAAVRIREVAAIARTALGKAPLIRKVDR